jgi:hypothetical protein
LAGDDFLALFVIFPVFSQKSPFFPGAKGPHKDKENFWKPTQVLEFYDLAPKTTFPETYLFI